MRTITFGENKFELSTQAYIMFISVIIMFVVRFIAAFISDSPLISMIMIIILAAVFIPLFTYVINCFTVGKCVKLSWFYAILYVIITAMYVLGFIFAVMNGTVKTEVSPMPPIYKGTFSKSK